MEGAVKSMPTWFPSTYRLHMQPRFAMVCSCRLPHLAHWPCPPQDSSYIKALARALATIEIFRSLANSASSKLIPEYQSRFVTGFLPSLGCPCRNTLAPVGVCGMLCIKLAPPERIHRIVRLPL